MILVILICVVVKRKLLYLSESKFYSKYMHLSLSPLANIYLIGVLFAKKFSSVIDSESCACMVLRVFQYTDIQLLHLFSFSVIMSSTSYIAILQIPLSQLIYVLYCSYSLCSFSIVSDEFIF